MSSRSLVAAAARRSESAGRPRRRRRRAAADRGADRRPAPRATLRPSRAISVLSILISRNGRPAICSTFTSSAPGDAAQDRRRSALAAFSIGVELVAEHLDRDIAAHAGEQLVEAHLDRLREFVDDCRGAARRAASMRRDQLVLGQLRIGPLLLRLQDDEGVGSIGRHRIGRRPRPCRSWRRHRRPREARDRVLDLELHRLRLRERRRWECGSACIARFFSSSVGMNSWPRRANSSSASDENAPAPMAIGLHGAAHRARRAAAR